MPDLHHRTLPNGMTLLFSPQPHLHAVYAGLYFRGGTLWEDRRTQGVTHLLEHLCFRGLGGLSSAGRDAVLDRIGARLDGATYPDAMVFRMETHPECLPDMLGLCLRFFADVPWTETQIREEKQVVLRQIEEDDCDFDETAERRWRRTRAGAFPLMGTPEVIERMSPAVIRAWQRRVFRPGNACLCLTGAFTSAEEEGLVRAFAALREPAAAEPFVQPEPLDFCRRSVRSDLMLADSGSHAKVRIAFDLDPALPQLEADVLSAITGEDDYSLLFRRIREELALVAEIDSSIEELGSYRRMVIAFDARQEVLAETLQTVFALLREEKRVITPRQLEEARMLFTRNLDFFEDDAAGMNAELGWGFIAGDLSRCALPARAARFGALAPEDIRGAAERVFRPENLSLYIQRDPKRARGIRTLALCLRDSLA